MKRIIFAAAAVVLIGLPAPSLAQAGWSVDRIIEQLRPPVNLYDHDPASIRAVVGACSPQIDRFYNATSRIPGRNFLSMVVGIVGMVGSVGVHVDPESLRREARQARANAAKYQNDSGGLDPALREEYVAEMLTTVCIAEAIVGPTSSAPTPAGASRPSPSASSPSSATPSPPARLPASSADDLQTWEQFNQENKDALEEGNNAVLALLDRPEKAAAKPARPRLLDEGEDASPCLDLRFASAPGEADKLVNVCPYVVEGLWCVVGWDCRPSYTNMKTFHPGDVWPALGTSREGRGRQTKWAACRGANSIRGDAMPFIHHCDKAGGP